jgi:hypothetical protein
MASKDDVREATSAAETAVRSRTGSKEKEFVAQSSEDVRHQGVKGRSTLNGVQFERALSR